MIRVLAARIAKLGELKATGRRLLVLGRGVVPVLADRALKGDNFAHFRVLLVWPTTSVGKQPSLIQVTRRDAGLMGPCCPIPEIVVRDQSGQAHALPHLLSTKSP
jgi:hypothetical protein